MPAALGQVDAWLESPSLVLIGESREYWALLRASLEDGRVVGARVQDGRIAAICELHGVRELWTQDRAFSRFPRLRTYDPLVA